MFPQTSELPLSRSENGRVTTMAVFAGQRGISQRRGYHHCNEIRFESVDGVRIYLYTSCYRVDSLVPPAFIVQPSKQSFSRPWSSQKKCGFCHPLVQSPKAKRGTPVKATQHWSCKRDQIRAWRTSHVVDINPISLKFLTDSMRPPAPGCTTLRMPPLRTRWPCRWALSFPLLQSLIF